MFLKVRFGKETPLSGGVQPARRVSLFLSNSRSLTAALSLPLRSRTCWRFFLGRLGGVNRAVLKSRSSGQAERERAPCLSFEFKLSSGRERDASGRYPKSRIAPRGFGFKTAGASVACSSGYGSSHLELVSSELKLPRQPSPLGMRGGEFERGVGALEPGTRGRYHHTPTDRNGGSIR